MSSAWKVLSIITHMCVCFLIAACIQAWSYRLLARGSALGKSSVRCYSEAAGDERYIQYSKVATDHFQHGLPRLPIPKLEETLQRYLASVEPVCSEEQFAQTKAAVTEFQTEGQGTTVTTAMRCYLQHTCTLNCYGYSCMCLCM